MTENDQTFLSLRVVRVIDYERMGIEEDSAGLVERNAMLGTVQRVFVWVPLKPQLVYSYIVVDRAVAVPSPDA